MNKIFKSIALIALGGALFSSCKSTPEASVKIDREALVARHAVHISEFDTLNSLSVGNGEFAFTVDPTGLQSFPEMYSKGMPLGTQSEWGWHSFENTEDFKREETYRYYEIEGRQVPYSMQKKDSERSRGAMNYFRQNPHRIHLGAVGVEFSKADGSIIPATEITNIDQTLDMWQGAIHSIYLVDGKKVEVTTICHPDKDMISANIKSELLASGQLKIKLRFPFPSAGHVDDACNWSNIDGHKTVITANDASSATIEHTIGTYSYNTSLAWSSDAAISSTQPHIFILAPKGGSEFSFSTQFTEAGEAPALNSFAETMQASTNAWKEFWSTGGAVDLSGSTDKRAIELERRIVLSQYLTRIQCAGNYCPQETGLTCNSWYGKFHLEMHWWHGAQWALWDRVDLLEKSLGWYSDILEKAKVKAQRQGYEGVRWPKMTDINGDDSPSSVGEFLIWQQPHIIYFAELAYRHYKDEATLKKYSELVFATADFMASFPIWDEATKRYILGPPLIPAQECLPREENVNPPFELVYWRMGLSIAQEWRTRLGMAPNEKYQKILDHFSKLTVVDGKYVAAETAADSYTNPHFMSDHPIILGAYGMLPGEGLVDTAIMSNTFDFIFDNWLWDTTWGWDYPLTAMSATRLGKPERAVDALLMDVQKNTYLKNGHNYQDNRLRLYLPGNGGLLSAVAMMCAGYDGCTEKTPGFPKKGWNVKWENLSKMP